MPILFEKCSSKISRFFFFIILEMVWKKDSIKYKYCFKPKVRKALKPKFWNINLNKFIITNCLLEYFFCTNYQVSLKNKIYDNYYYFLFYKKYQNLIKFYQY